MCRLILSHNSVDIWQINLDLASDRFEELRLTLSADELERGHRYYRQRDRNHFICCRGILRTILGHYLDKLPQSLEFGYSNKGKPFLLNNDSLALEFNVSHSQDLALIAITLNYPIGIDLEYIRPINIHQLAARFFTAREYNNLCLLPEAEQNLGFFQLWTYKEAYLKATGMGLSGLKQVEFVLSNLQEYLHIRPNWYGRKLELGSNYTGAIFSQKNDCELNYYHFNSFQL